MAPVNVAPPRSWIAPHTAPTISWDRRGAKSGPFPPEVWRLKATAQPRKLTDPAELYALDDIRKRNEDGVGYCRPVVLEEAFPVWRGYGCPDGILKRQAEKAGLQQTQGMEVSIEHKVSSAKTTTSHLSPGRDSLEGPPNIPRPVAQLEKVPTSDTKAPQKAQNLPLTREGTSTDRTRNIAATSGLGSQRGVPRSLRTSTTPKMSQTFIQLGPVRHESSSSTRHDHEGFALPPSLPECVQGLLRVDEINYTSVVIDPQQQGQNLRLWISWGISAIRKAGFFSRSATD
ncbi:hypothetical protein B0H13DRAFT_1869746 [Mycena leptocephala]|nr:hypothetical protein B0H13DRAFT_1869746 [Mycena leptocephala]